MKWVTINETHVNASYIHTFYWKNGVLALFFNGDKCPVKLKDPDGELYRDICRQLDVNAVKE